MRNLFTLTLLFITAFVSAQVKVGNNPATINTNSLLELESTNKGFLPPRIALNNASLVAPLTGTVPAGMLVYSTGGTLTDGFYYWNGTSWRILATSELNSVSKTANATLLKSETFILASNDITITLPVVSASDNGLSITVKNVGSHTNLVTVKGSGAATIDGIATIGMTRNNALTFVANGTNWVLKNKKNSPDNILEVNANSSWTTIEEALEFLEVHMTGSAVIRLNDESYDVAATIVVDLPHALTIQGNSYGNTTISAATGLTGKPMFRCLTDCFFKMLAFDATGLSGYGTQANEDAIRFVGPKTYNEVKDCNFDRFYTTILDSTDAEVWIFETDINNAQAHGILLHSAQDSVILKVAETDFINCKSGIYLRKGDKATIQIASGGYYNSVTTDTAIVYRPSTFTSFLSMSITGNSWNNIGKFVEGFDFTRTDGRDANALLVNNAGMADKNPSCYFNVINNISATATTLPTTWYKGIWTNTSSITCKWTVGNNRLTYQPTNRRDAYITISGNIMVNSSSATINLGLVKNPSGTSSLLGLITRYGETTLRPGVANQPFQFSMVVYLTDIAPNDFFELWVNTGSIASAVTFQDLQLIVNTH